ncbi:hypothetical protein Tco_0540841 [Tanacetum coccineum]
MHDDPRPAAGSFNMADVRSLSAHVVKLRDMPKGVLVLSRLIQVWKSRICDPVLRGSNGNVMGIYNFICLPEWTSAEVQEEPHLDRILLLGYPIPSFIAKAEASQKRKASTSGAASSHVAKRTRFSLAQSFGSTSRPSLFVGDSDDESDGDDDACVEIPLVTPLCYISKGKGYYCVDDAAAPLGGVGVVGTCVAMYVDVAMRIEFLARYRGLNQSYHVTVSTLKKQVSGLNDKLAT